MQLLLDSSIVAVNCVHVGDGGRAGPSREKQRWIHYRCQFMETCWCSLCHAAVSCQLTRLSYFPH